MKRSGLVAVAALMVMLSACGTPTRTPQQVFDAATAKMLALKSYKLNLTMNASGSISQAATSCTAAGDLPAALKPSMAEQFNKMTPQQRVQFCAQLAKSAAAAPKVFSTNMSGSGEVQLPNAMHMSMTMAFGGISVTTEVITYQGTTYFKDPTSGAWKSLDQMGLGLNSSSFGQLDANANLAALSAAKSVTDLGDTVIGNVRVHHYRATLDPAKLKALADAQQIFKDPKMNDLLKTYGDILANETTTLEVWIGINDDLLRREVLDETPLAAAAGSSPSTEMLSDLKTHVQMDFHDFNAKVDITPPVVG